MSHELRTPLNAIIGFASFLSSANPNSLSREQELDYLEAIETSGQDLLAMINDVIDISKIEEDRFELDIEQLRIQEIVD